MENAKVVFVNRYFHPDVSATSQLLTDLATALAGSGLAIHVICSRQRYDDPHARMPSRESLGGVRVRRVWSTRFGRTALPGRVVDYATFYLSSALALLTTLGRGDIVVAETDPPLMSVVAAAVARLKGARLINWLQDLFPEVASVLGANPLPGPVDRWLKRRRDASLRGARINVVLGERMRERLRRLGIPDEKIAIIHNWAELTPAAPLDAARSRLRTQLGITTEFVVGYSGNLGRAHDFSTLLAAAERLQGFPDVVFLMIGGGAGMAQLARRVESLGLCNFRFLPYQPREALGDALAAADAHWVSLRPELEGLIVPSKFYGILAAGRPVIFIGDADGELARVIAQCGCGGAVPVGDSAALARLILAWKDDPALREAMAQRGYQRYVDRYGAQRAIHQWRDILRRPNPPAGA